MTDLNPTQLSIMGYFESKVGPDFKLRNTSLYTIACGIGSGESFTGKCIRELITKGYLKREGGDAIGTSFVYEVMTLNRWKLTFGTVCTFTSEEKARNYIRENWGLHDRRKPRARPAIIPNGKYANSYIPVEKKPTKHTFENAATIQVVEPKIPLLEGNDPQTLSLCAFDELSTFPGFHGCPKGYIRALYMPILESTIRQCKSCTRQECPITKGNRECWADKKLTALIHAGEMS